MSIFSKIKRAAKKYVSNVVGGAKIVGSAVSKAYSSAKKTISTAGKNLGKNISAGVLNAVGRSALPESYGQSSQLPGSTIAQNQIDARNKANFNPVGGGGNIQNAIDTGQYSGGGGGNNTALSPGQFGGATRPPVRTLGAGQSTPTVDNSFFQSTNTRTISPSTFNGTGTSIINGNNPSISMPGAPSNRDTGIVGLQGLASPNSKLTENGLFDTQGNLQVENKNKEDDVAKAIRELSEIPKQENVYEDTRIQAQNEEVRRQKQEVNNWQGQLNNIVAKQQQDLMRHEKEISLAGGTVEGFSGRAAAINREAAYAALPIQAQLATSQGNLELAQDYLKELTGMVKEEIDNNFNYKVAQYNTVKEIADKREKKMLDDLEKQETRAYKESQDNLDLVDAWMQEAVSNKQPNLINRLSKLDIYSPNFRQNLADILGQMREPSSPSENTPSEKSMSTNQIEQFRRSYGWTPPFGYTQNQLIQFMNDNPGLNPEQYEQLVNQASKENNSSKEDIQSSGGSSGITYQGEKFIDDFTIQSDFPKLDPQKTMQQVETARAAGYNDIEIYNLLKAR